MSSIIQESWLTLAYWESWYIQNLRNIQNPVKHLWCNVFFNEPWHIYDEVFYSESYANIKCIDSWCILNLSIFRTQDIQDTLNLYDTVYTEPCVTLTYSKPMYIQALAHWEPEEYDGPFSIESCMTLVYSELEAYLNPCIISIMENFIQNNVWP